LIYKSIYLLASNFKEYNLDFILFFYFIFCFLKAFIMGKENGGEIKENGTRENGNKDRLLDLENIWEKIKIIIGGYFRII
jgi:hypothetical protein